VLSSLIPGFDRSCALLLIFVHRIAGILSRQDSSCRVVGFDKNSIRAPVLGERPYIRAGYQLL